MNFFSFKSQFSGRLGLFKRTLDLPTLDELQVNSHKPFEKLIYRCENRFLSYSNYKTIYYHNLFNHYLIAIKFIYLIFTK